MLAVSGINFKSNLQSNTISNNQQNQVIKMHSQPIMDSVSFSGFKPTPVLTREEFTILSDIKELVEKGFSSFTYGTNKFSKQDGKITVCMSNRFLPEYDSIETIQSSLKEPGKLFVYNPVKLICHIFTSEKGVSEESIAKALQIKNDSFDKVLMLKKNLSAMKEENDIFEGAEELINTKIEKEEQSILPRILDATGVELKSVEL